MIVKSGRRARLKELEARRPELTESEWISITIDAMTDAELIDAIRNTRADRNYVITPNKTLKVDREKLELSRAIASMTNAEKMSELRRYERILEDTGPTYGAPAQPEPLSLRGELLEARCRNELLDHHSEEEINAWCEANPGRWLVFMSFEAGGMDNEKAALPGPG